MITDKQQQHCIMLSNCLTKRLMESSTNPRVYSCLGVEMVDDLVKFVSGNGVCSSADTMAELMKVLGMILVASWHVLWLTGSEVMLIVLSR